MKTALDLADAAALGRSLRAIDPTMLKRPAPDRIALWWKGEERYLDVFIESDEWGVAWLQVTARCRALTWDRATNTLRTGETDEIALGSPYPGSKMVTHHQAVDDAVVAFALAILDAAPELQGAAACIRAARSR